MRNEQGSHLGAVTVSRSPNSEDSARVTQHDKRKNKTRKSASDSRMDVANGTVAESSFNNTALNSPAQFPENVNGSEECELKYGAAHVINLFVPVSLCMAVVILTMSTIGYYSQDDGVYLIYTPFTKKTDNTSEIIMMSIGNALTMLAMVIAMSMVLIFLYTFRFYRVIHGWLIISSMVLLSLFTMMYLSEVFQNYNASVDYLSFIFFTWNYACLGLICIHWKGPLLLQQFYLIIMSALMALIFIKFLPEWTVWTVLAALSIWDLVAVLCPKGPLRMLVETAQERNEPIFPALIYSSSVLYLYFILTTPNNSTELLASTDEDVEENGHSAVLQPSTSSSTAQVSHNPAPTSSAVRYAPLRKSGNDGDVVSDGTFSTRRAGENASRSCPAQSTHRRSQSATVAQPPPNAEVEERGVKLGLGDFIFYSVLVGKASSFGDWNTTIACYVAILVGLAFTLMLLALFHKALPALPISIFLGIVFFFASRIFMSPFISELSLRRYVL